MRWRPVAVAVLDDHGSEIENTAKSTQAHKSDTYAVTRMVVGRIFRQKGIRRNDASNVPKSNLPRCTHSAAMMATKVHVEPANDHWHGTIRAHGHEKKCRILQMMPVVDCYENGESSNGNTDWDQSEEEPVFEFVGECGD